MTEEQKSIRMRSRLVIYVVFFAVAAYIAYQTPYCHDEWKWGSPERIELMKRGFANYNGRYLGNILALIITRSKIAKTLIMAGGITWLLYVMEQNLTSSSDTWKDNKKGNMFLLLCSVLMLCTLPKTLYAQSFGWPAAFVNFVPPVILFLIYYNWTEPLFEGKDGTGLYSHFQLLMALPLGIATQLFCEHITVFVVIYGAGVLLLTWIQKRKIYGMHTVYFIGTLIGAAIMFSNGAYHRAATNPNGYKHIKISLLSMYQQLSDTILDNLFLNNWILNVLLAAILTYFIMKSGRKTFWNAALMLILCGFSVYSIWNRLNPEWIFMGSETLNHIIRIFLSFLYFINVLLCIWKNVSGGKTSCALYLFSAIAAAPLLVANPIGPRCFFISYILESLALLKLVRYVLERETVDFYYPILGILFSVIVLGFIYARMFSMIGAADNRRQEIIEEAAQKDEREIILPVLPYAGYCWITIPQNEEWEKYFKQFYGISQEVNLRFE